MTYIAHCASDYHAFDRFVTVDKKLAYMPYAQAGVLTRDHSVQLVSYETIVAEIDDGWLHVYGTFSATTRKHIGAFLKEYAPHVTYYDAKSCYMDDVEINVETGEIRQAANGMIQTIGLKHKPYAA